jgi:hypothetical protein
MPGSVIAFFGLRLSVGEDEIESLEMRSHRIIQESRKIGLQHYWGNFGLPGETYFLFVGRLVAKIGPEDSSEVRVTELQLAEMASLVTSKLLEIGLTDPPSFILQFQPD